MTTRGRHAAGVFRLHPSLCVCVCVSQIYAFWVEPKNYVEVTRSWYAEHLPFPLNFFLPGQMQRHQLDKLRLLRGDESLEASEEVEKEVTPHLHHHHHRLHCINRRQCRVVENMRLTVSCALFFF